jgi:hypothetical protein
MSVLESNPGALRRIVLIDFDWDDADTLPELLRAPGVRVQRVIGIDAENPGVRVAELYGLPHSLELADLTREVFDLAIVGERSPRREQVERLLRALGTPLQTPAGHNGIPHERRDAGDEAPRAERDTSEVGEPLAEAAWAMESIEPVTGATFDAGAWGNQPLPGPDDPVELERRLTSWAAETHSSSAALYLLEPERQVRLCRTGPEDPLLESLAQLSSRLDAPHVLVREDGPQHGRLWAAWPFRACGQRAILAVAGADASRGRQVWEEAVRALEVAWSPPDSEGATSVNVLPVEVFARRVQMALDRHRADGFRFALHRLDFGSHDAALEALLARLPQRLRGADCVCRPSPHELLLLCAGSSRAFHVVRRRIGELWREAWAATGRSGPVVEPRDERWEIGASQDITEWLRVAEGWFPPR